MTARSTVAVLLAVVLGLLAAAPATAAGPDEAVRQLRFARAELAAGSWDRALQSADSALTLDPALAEARVLKALAYEGLGELAIAQALLLAHREALGGSLADGSEAAAALARIDERLARGDAGGGETALALLDPAVIRHRVETALGEGRCAGAESAAAELVRADPELADGWRLRGDAFRCSNRNRPALLAYRRYQQQGGDDEAVDRLIEDLRLALAGVRVTVELVEGSSVPRLRLSTDSEELSPSAQADGTFLFEDLPTGVAMSLEVAGRGLEPETHAVPALSSGTEHAVEVAPTFVGLGRVSVSEFDPAALSVRLVTRDQGVDASPGQVVTVTAGRVSAEVRTDQGVAAVPLRVEPQAEIAFDPVPYRPAALTLVGLPAGADVVVVVEGAEGRQLTRTERLPRAVGDIDPETGVRVAPPLALDSLVGGGGGLYVSHPVLGEGQQELTLGEATANAATFEWRGSEGMTDGVSRVQAAYDLWQEQRLAATLQARQRTAALGVTTGVLAAAGAGLLVAGVVQSRLADDLQAQADAMQQIGDGDKVGEVRARFDEARARERALVSVGWVGTGAAGAGLVLTIGSAAQVRRAADSVGPWEPWEAAGAED